MAREFPWMTTGMECDMGDHILEIEQFEGKYYWKIKTILNRVVKEGQASRLANAKNGVEREYKAVIGE